MGADADGGGGQHQRYLRWLATLLAGVLLLLGLALGALSLWVWQVKPLQTVGVHGMLPKDYASWIMAGLVGWNAAVLLVAALLAALARLRSLLGRAAAMILGLAGLVTGPNLLPLLTMRSEWVWWGSALLVATASAGLLGLTVAAQLEVSRVVQGPWVWLRRPLLTAALIAGGSLALRGYGVLSAQRTHEQDEKEQREREAGYRREEAAAAARFHACEQADDWSVFCGAAKALAVSSNGQWLSTVGNEVVVWDVAKRRRAWSAANPARFGGPQSALVSDDGQHVIRFETNHGKASLVDVSGQARTPPSCPDKTGRSFNSMARFALSPNGRQAVIVADRVCLFDLIDAAQVVELPVECRGGLPVFTNDGKALWLACTHTLHRIEVASGKETLALDTVVESPHQEGRSARPWYASLGLSADGSRLLALWGHDTSLCSVDERDATSGAPLDTTAVPACDRYKESKWLYPFVVVPSVMNDTFSLVDLERHAPASLTPPGLGPRQVAASRDGKVAFVAKLNGNIRDPAPTVQRWDPTSPTR